MDCFFCPCVSGRESAAVVYQDELVLAMMAPGPANPGHVLITPAQHIERLGGMEEEAGIHLFRIAMRMQRAIENSSIKCEGIYLGLAEGVGSLHIVPHLYIDLVPRFRDDRYEILATIDRPHDQPDALLRHLFDDRVRRWLGKARRANEVDPSPSRLDDVAAEIRNSYAAIWGGLA